MSWFFFLSFFPNMSSFFEKINRINKSLTKLKKKKIANIRNEKGDVTKDPPDIKRI